MNKQIFHKSHVTENYYGNYKRIENDNTGNLRKNKHFIVKRILDILISILAIIFLSPVFLFFSILIKLEDKGKVIFKQVRVGIDEKPFVLYKFRSMSMDAESRLCEFLDRNERDGPVFKIKNDPRETKIGNFIRKTCIDELPQLINVIKGDMSIVGPRPALPSEVKKYTQQHLKRLSVKPGLTCYWQTQKHNNTSFEEWMAMDIKYINDYCLLTDMKIIFNTFPILLMRNGDN